MPMNQAVFRSGIIVFLTAIVFFGRYEVCHAGKSATFAQLNRGRNLKSVRAIRQQAMRSAFKKEKRSLPLPSFQVQLPGKPLEYRNRHSSRPCFSLKGSLALVASLILVSEGSEA